MKNNWEIIDSKGTIHSGTEDEMRSAFDMMISTVYEISGNDEQAGTVKKYLTSWEGDLKLIEVHGIHK